MEPFGDEQPELGRTRLMYFPFPDPALAGPAFSARRISSFGRRVSEVGETRSERIE
jgi:hypothetical protein